MQLNIFNRTQLKILIYERRLTTCFLFTLYFLAIFRISSSKSQIIQIPLQESTTVPLSFKLFEN